MPQFTGLKGVNSGQNFPKETRNARAWPTPAPAPAPAAANMEPAKKLPKELIGYATLFNVPYDMGSHYEQIASGCLDNANFGDCAFLRDHNSSLILGRIGTPSLSAKADRIGLFVRSILPDTALAEETAELVSQGIISRMSWGWGGTVDKWEKYQGTQLRTILSVKFVYDVSVVTFPAFAGTSVALARSANSDSKTAILAPAFNWEQSEMDQHFFTY